MALMAIWVTAILCFGFKRDETVLKVTRESLVRQVQELRELKEKFEWIAQTDPLTELPNRRGMSEKLEFEKLRYKRSEKPFGIILADMDSLKQINDNLGHDAGDKILIQIAKIFRFCCRRTDLVARWGGDEFMVLLPDTDLEGTQTIAEKIRGQNRKPAVPLRDADNHSGYEFWCLRVRSGRIGFEQPHQAGRQLSL